MQVLAKVRSRKLSGYQALLATLAGALFMAVCAKMTFFLPGNPVPVTAQVFGVILCGMLLGSRRGVLSQVTYIAAGLIGAPIFCGSVAGPIVLAGPTVGYLVGFIAAAYMVGRLMETKDSPSFKFACMTGLLGVGIILTCGVGWLAIWPGRPFPGLTAWLIGAAPFVCLDAAKAVIAARLVTGRQ
jgi:biotin transport system substrate-specific component